MSENIKDLIDAVADGRTHDADEAFKAEISNRVSDSIDAKRVEVATSMTAGSSVSEE